VKKTKQNMIDCIFTTINFDLWMSKGAYDIFSFVINFVGPNYEPKQMIMGLLGPTPYG
jgi:hypothetical protein